MASDPQVGPDPSAISSVTLLEGFIPVVDFSAARSDPVRREELARSIAEACAGSGFLVVTGHGIDPALIASMYERTEAFFLLPEEEKDRVSNVKGSVGFSRSGGYVAASIGVDTPPDLCQRFNINRFGEPGVAEGVELGPDRDRLTVANRWPERPSGFKAVWLSYYEALEAFAEELMRLFALALELPEGFFDDKIDQHMTGMTANFYYPPTVAALDGQFRKGPHTDWGSLTILYQDDRGGLQVEQDGHGWLDVPYVPGSFVINLGDLMAEWTSGRWVSTMHRVLAASYPESTRHRISIAFFHQPNFDAVIEPIFGPAPGAVPRTAPVTSGAWIAEKLLASYGPREADDRVRQGTDG
jgi:isopenicillin N synthase-like dioxygenase